MLGHWVDLMEPRGEGVRSGAETIFFSHLNVPKVTTDGIWKNAETALKNECCVKSLPVL